MGELLQVSHIQKGGLRGVLSVDIQGVRIVEELKNIISARYELPRLTLFYRGVNLNEHAQLALEYLIPNLQKIGAPRFSARSILHSSDATELSLFVRNCLGGRKFQVDLLVGSTVADLEQAINDHEGGLDQNMYELVFDGVMLRSDVELTEYNLVSGNTVFLLWTIVGGGGAPTVDFVDMENASALRICKVVYSSSTSHWRGIQVGLNLQGNCRNRRCGAFGSEYVGCKLGFTIFNVAQTVHCPACKYQIKAITCGFFGCQWMFEGRKMKADGSSVDIMSSWKETKPEEYQWFDEAGRRNMAEWSNLVIMVELDRGSGDCCAARFGRLKLNSSAEVDKIV